MKLSEVQKAHDLVGSRRKLVTAYVEVGARSDIYVPYGFGGAAPTVFGYAVDKPMREALRKAARQEIRRRIEECDAQLAKLGVEVDGIEIAIRCEETALKAALGEKAEVEVAT